MAFFRTATEASNRLDEYLHNENEYNNQFGISTTASDQEHYYYNDEEEYDENGDLQNAPIDGGATDYNEKMKQQLATMEAERRAFEEQMARSAAELSSSPSPNRPSQDGGNGNEAALNDAGGVATTNEDGVSALNLQEMGITCLDGMPSWQTVEILNLKGNHLVNTYGIPTMVNLKFLHLDDNRITSFLGMSHQPKIEILTMEGNPICHHPHFRIMALLACGESLKIINYRVVTEDERRICVLLGGSGSWAARAISYGWTNLQLKELPDAFYSELIKGLREEYPKAVASIDPSKTLRKVLELQGLLKPVDPVEEAAKEELRKYKENMTWHENSPSPFDRKDPSAKRRAGHTAGKTPRQHSPPNQQLQLEDPQQRFVPLPPEHTNLHRDNNVATAFREVVTRRDDHRQQHQQQRAPAESHSMLQEQLLSASRHADPYNSSTAAAASSSAVAGQLTLKDFNDFYRTTGMPHDVQHGHYTPGGSGRTNSGGGANLNNDHAALAMEKPQLQQVPHAVGASATTPRQQQQQQQNSRKYQTPSHRGDAPSSGTTTALPQDLSAQWGTPNSYGAAVDAARKYKDRFVRTGTVKGMTGVATMHNTVDNCASLLPADGAGRVDNDDRPDSSIPFAEHHPHQSQTTSGKQRRRGGGGADGSTAPNTHDMDPALLLLQSEVGCLSSIHLDSLDIRIVAEGNTTVTNATCKISSSTGCLHILESSGRCVYSVELAQCKDIQYDRMEGSVTIQGASKLEDDDNDGRSVVGGGAGGRTLTRRHKQKANIHLIVRSESIIGGLGGGTPTIQKRSPQQRASLAKGIFKMLMVFKCTPVELSTFYSRVQVTEVRKSGGSGAGGQR